MTELVIGKYEFCPYDREPEKVVTLDDLDELLKKCKDKRAKAIKKGRPDGPQKNLKRING